MKYQRCVRNLIALTATATVVILATISTAGATGSPHPAHPATGGAVAAGSAKSQAITRTPGKANSAPCLFNPVVSCGSTDLTVTVDWWSSSGAIQFGCSWNATVNWGDGTPTQTVSITSTTTYAFLASHTYAQPGPEDITLGGSGVQSECVVIPGTFHFDPSDHYVVSTEAWIPFAAVVDPEMPLTELYSQTLGIQDVLDPNCYTPSLLQSLIATVSSTYRGDNHTQFGGSYRLATEASFDYNRFTDTITNFDGDPVAAAGSSHRDKVYKVLGKVIGKCTATATATNDQTAELDSDTSFTVGYDGKNPLIEPQFLAPPIVGSISGSLAQDGSLTLTYDTTQFPSHGIQVSIDGQTVLTTIENDASCLPNQDVLGPVGALTLLRGLTRHETGSVTAAPGGSTSVSKPSPLC